MEFEKQKPVSDGYRDNWDRIYREAHVGPIEIEAANVRYYETKDGENWQEFYPNGCPILEDK